MITQLYIRSCFDGIHGFGAQIRSHLRLLDKAQIPYHLIHVPLDPNVVETDEIKKWRKLVSKTLPPPGSVVINILEACYYEFYKGCYHIGLTHWEVDGLPSYPSSINSDLAWVEAFNRCDEVWTGAESAKACFISNGVTKPIKVVPWAIPENFPRKSRATALPTHHLPNWKVSPSTHSKLRPIFRFLSKLPKLVRGPLITIGYLTFNGLSALKKTLSGFFIIRRTETIHPDENFFTIICSNTFNERKNLKDLVAAVLFEFKEKDKVRLVLRTHQSIDTWWMKALIISKIIEWVGDLKIDNAPSIYIANNKMNDSEYLQFLSLGDVFANSSRGEGVGGGVLQSMALGIPAVTHLFSSPGDFCNSNCSFVYNYSLEPVAWNFNFYGMRQQWARPDMTSFRQALREAYNLWKSSPSEFSKKCEASRESALKYGNPVIVIDAYKDALTKTNHRP